MNRQQTLLARAILYHQAARLFAYPDDQMGELLAEGRTVAGALPDGGRLAERFAAVEAAWTEAQESAAGAAGEYTWLFQRNVQCSLHETAYDQARNVVMAHDLAAIAGFYAAFGVQIAEGFRDLPDHLSMELEFVSFLYVKEAYALEQGWRSLANVCRVARRRFLGEHLARWFPAFAARVGQRARLRLYPAAAAVVQALLEGEAVRVEASDVPATVAPA
jgi:DMSO reductase family type II enzyme chaperone